MKEGMYSPTEASTPSRLPERARYDSATVHGILDSAILCHVGYEAEGRPQVLPMLFVRVGGTIYLHSSTGGHPARMAAREGGIDLCVEVTIIDALVLARSAFHHSANYRAVVAHGRATVVADLTEKRRVLATLVDKIVPGRGADVRDPSEIELRQTAVLALPLYSVSAKVRDGGPIDDAEDMTRACWAGIVPIREVRGVPQAAPDLTAGTPVPEYLNRIGVGR